MCNSSNKTVKYKCKFKSAVKVYKHLIKKVKVQQSHYRPEEAQRIPGGRGSQISRQSAHEGGKVVSPRHRPPLPPGSNPGTHFC